MALQVRLRHALGEKVVELPPREVAEPLVIGRAREADLQVPSVSVAPRHCALFLHEGQWVVQGLAGVTKVNGQPVEGPRVLNVGDVLTVGTDPTPPSIEIDPLSAAEGRTGPAGVAPRMPSLPVARPMTPPAAWAPAPAHQSYNPPQYLRAPSPVPPPVPPPVAYEPAPAETEPQDDSLTWAAAAQSTTRYYVPRRRQSSAVGAVLAVLFGVALLAGTGFFVYQQLQMKQTVAKASPASTSPSPPPAPVEQEANPRVHSKLFDVRGDQQKARQGSRRQNPQPPPHNAVPTEQDDADNSGSSSPTTAGESSEPPVKDPPDADATAGKEGASLEDADNEIEAAHLSAENQGVAILKYDDYRRLHPGRHTKELDKYTEEAVDRLWWQRIDQLWKKRNRLSGDIKKAEQDIAAQPAGAFHNQLVKQKADLEAQRGKVEETLKDEMGYKSDTGPDLTDPKQLTELAKSRDGAKYADFRKRTLASVRAHHGEVPWAGDQ